MDATAGGFGGALGAIAPEAGVIELVALTASAVMAVGAMLLARKALANLPGKGGKHGEEGGPPRSSLGAPAALTVTGEAREGALLTRGLWTGSRVGAGAILLVVGVIWRGPGKPIFSQSSKIGFRAIGTIIVAFA